MTPATGGTAAGSGTGTTPATGGSAAGLGTGTTPATGGSAAGSAMTSATGGALTIGTFNIFVPYPYSEQFFTRN